LVGGKTYKTYTVIAIPNPDQGGAGKFVLRPINGEGHDIEVSIEDLQDGSWHAGS